MSNPLDFDISLEYSYDGIDWNEWDFNSLTINQGDSLYIRGYNPDGFSYWNEDKTYYKFIIEGDNVSCSGNIMSLINHDNMPNIIPCEYCFYGLFKGCTSLITAPELPVNELADYCCGNMFDGCEFKDCTFLKDKK